MKRGGGHSIAETRRNGNADGGFVSRKKRRGGNTGNQTGARLLTMAMTEYAYNPKAPLGIPLKKLWCGERRLPPSLKSKENPTTHFHSYSKYETHSGAPNLKKGRLPQIYPKQELPVLVACSPTSPAKSNAGKHHQQPCVAKAQIASVQKTFPGVSVGHSLRALLVHGKSAQPLFEGAKWHSTKRRPVHPLTVHRLLVLIL